MSIFAKRHYEAIAKELQYVNHASGPLGAAYHAGVKDAIRSLADTFARDNGMFKRDRFIAACEPGANVRART